MFAMRQQILEIDFKRRALNSLSVDCKTVIEKCRTAIEPMLNFGSSEVSVLLAYTGEKCYRHELDVTGNKHPAAVRGFYEVPVESMPLLATEEDGDDDDLDGFGEGIPDGDDGDADDELL
ncbi:MAG: hypothetical protein HQL31_06355, partial [Planctomycetes bacterium]|nr:hypothetical protein [Planctomycetota bacterium]